VSATPGGQPLPFNPYTQQYGYPPTTGLPPSGVSGGTPSQPGQPGQDWHGQYLNQINPQDLQSLQTWFSSVDKDGSGEISVQELSQLNFNSKLLGEAAARQLIAIFDKDRSGTINFNEYASVNQFLTTLLAQFQQVESKNPGFIAFNDIAPALQGAGFTGTSTLSATSASNVAKRFDTQKRGQLTWEEFVLLAAHVGLLRSVFEWSDSDRDGKATFDFEGFTYATLYL
jgi:Ca2+-binding EF-hand superfamily protein